MFFCKFLVFPDVREPIVRRYRRIRKSSSVQRQDATVLVTLQGITALTEVFRVVQELTNRKANQETDRTLNL